MNKGVIKSSVSADGVVTFEGLDTENDVFFGYYDGDSISSNIYSMSDKTCQYKRVMAYSADMFIDDVESWNLLVTAMDKTSNNAQGKTFMLTKDIIITSAFKSLVAFDGTLDGMTNSLIIRDDVSFGGVATLGENGTIKNIAIEVFNKDGFEVDAKVLPENGVENSILINYVGGDIAGGATSVVHVNNSTIPPVGGGFITVNGDGSKFSLDTNDLPEYKLRYWVTPDEITAGKTAKEIEDENLALTYINGNFYKNNELYDGDVVAVYFSCYTVSVIILGLDDVVFRPNVTETKTYWSDLEGEQTVEVKKTLGYIFWGFKYDDGMGGLTEDIPAEFSEAIEQVTPLKLSILVKEKLHSSINIYADYSLVSTSWETVVYGDLTESEMNDYLWIDADQNEKAIGKGYVIKRSCLPEGDTLNVVSELPRHAGNYKIKFTIQKIVNEDDKYTMGEAEFGFTIKTRELKFTSLVFEEKIYDTTFYAKVKDKTFVGLIPEDENNKDSLDFSDIKFAYYDPISGEFTKNAGNNYYVKVYSGELQNNSYGNYLHIDYKLPDDIIYQYTEKNGEYVKGSPFTYAIQKADLTLTISTITIDYLDQFKYEYKVGGVSFFDIDALFANCYKLSAGENGQVDADTIKNTKLLVISGDYIDENGVYHYNIRKPGDYEIITLTDALVNYNPKIYGGSARFIVNPSPVSVVLDEVEIEYGDDLVDLAYHIHSGTHVCKDENGDGVCDHSIYMSTELFEAYKTRFELDMTYDAFVAKYLSVTLDVLSIRKNGLTVSLPIPSEEHVYGVVFKFSAKNDCFTFDEISYYKEIKAEGQETQSADKILVSLEKVVYTESNEKEYILFVDNVLRILTRKISLQYTGETSKVFGSEDGDYAVSAKTVGKKLVNGDSVIVTRAKNVKGESEKVGSYSLVFSIRNAAGEDITSYYDISYANGEGYYYSITKRVAKVNHTGYNYYYGDVNEMSNMSYSTNLSEQLIKTILEVFGKPNATSLSAIGVEIKIGYFGSDYLKVGKYTDKTEIIYNAPDEVKQCIDFVLGNGVFNVIARKLTVKVANFSRDYNKSSALTFPKNATTYTVSGFVNGDDSKLVVKHSAYESNVTANAGTYYYRPSGCTIELKSGVSSSEYGYLLQNYAIGAIAYGNYTIKALNVKVNVSIGRFQEDGSFVESEGNSMYYGDANAALKFEVDNFPGYIAELYESEIEGKDLNDKELNDWMIEVLSLTHTPLWYCSIENIIMYAAATSSDEKSIYLHSENNNIKVETDGSFAVEDVYFTVKNVTISADSSLNDPKINCEVVPMYYDYDDSNYHEIEGYGFNGTVEGLSAGRKLKLSENFEICYNVESVSDSGECVYSLSANTFSNGRWIAAEEGVLRSGNEASAIEEGMTFSTPITVIYTDEEKLVSFIKENPVTLAVIVVGSVLLIVAGGIIGAVVYRKKRIARMAFLENVYQNLLSQNSGNAEGANEIESQNNNNSQQ